MELAERVTQIEVVQGRHDERISDLEDWRVKQNGTLAEIQKELKALREDFGSRPTWAVTVLIGLLSTLCGSMAIYIITH